MKAVQAGFIEIKTSKFTKKVNILLTLKTFSVYPRNGNYLSFLLYLRFKWILTWKIHCAAFVIGLLVHTSVVTSTASSTTVALAGNGNTLWMRLPITARSPVPPSQVAHSKMTFPPLLYVMNPPWFYNSSLYRLALRQQRFLMSTTFIIILFLFHHSVVITSRFNRYNLFNKS